MTKKARHASEFDGEINTEVTYTFSQDYDKVSAGYVRVVKYEDTTIKVFDKQDIEVTPAKPLLCRIVALVQNWSEDEYTAYASKNTTRSAGAKVIKFLRRK